MVSEEYQTAEINPDRIFSRIQEISYPRLVGSEGEIRAQTWVKQQISTVGYGYKIQQFQASFYRINTLVQISNLVALVLFLLTGMLFAIHPLLFLIPLGVILIDIYLVSTGSVQMSQPPKVPRFVKCYDSENIYAETPKRAENPEIIFMGHYDSKSSKLNGVMRLLMNLLLLAGALGVIIIGFIGMIFFFARGEIYTNLNQSMWVLSGIGAGAGFILCFNVVGNNSPGASDNGSAVAILLELMQYLKAHPIPKVNLTFLFSGAEEIGLTGALNFIRTRKEDPNWSPKKTFAINFDMAGQAGSILINTGVGLPKKLTSPTMCRFLEKIAKSQQLPLQEVYLPVGGWTDALPFIHYGYEIITFSGKNPKVHSKGDTPDCLDKIGLFNTVVMALELTKKVVEHYHQQSKP